MSTSAQVSIPAEIWYSSVLTCYHQGNRGEATWDLSRSSCKSANLFVYLCACVHVFTTAHVWKWEDNLRVGALLPPGGFWGLTGTEPMPKEATSLNLQRFLGDVETGSPHREGVQREQLLQAQD